MFRDSRGVVHTVSSAEPLADLPPGAAEALQRALLVPAGTSAVDIGSVVERCDAVLELVERWQDAFFSALPDEVDLEEEARWAAEAGLSLEEVEAGYEDEDDEEPFDLSSVEDQDDDPELDALVALGSEPGDPDDPRLLLPDELVTVLERELLLLPLRVRLEALVAAADLVSSWSDLVSDHEKLLGHLVLAHGDPATPALHEPLVDRHAVLHAATGPGHEPAS